MINFHLPISDKTSNPTSMKRLAIFLIFVGICGVGLEIYLSAEKQIQEQEAEEERAAASAKTAVLAKKPIPSAGPGD